MTQQYADHVRRGAELLDESRPGWEREIILEYLNMSSCVCCILGQLYGDYYGGLSRLAIESGVATDHLGFSDFGSLDYATLAAAWRVEIRARLERGAIPT